MPQQSQDRMKGTSPSKNIQRGIDTAWNAQNKQSSTSPQKVLSQKYTRNPIKVGK